MRAPIVVMFVALAAGVLAGDASDVSATAWGLLVALSLVLLGVAARRRYGVVVAAFVSLACAGALAARWHQ
ncbi:MAG: DUF3623 domain-containing protein, partial [Deltaproteobacteria bacterium]|nr:DUF3623 domain-containing protein [Deltaproteobacteria bacterium]